MVKPGNWQVELDDGGGADITTEIDGAVNLQVGELIGPLRGRQWRLADVKPDLMWARAIPHE